MSKQKPLIKKGQHHTKEFKQAAVKMVLEEHLEAAEVASRIGVKVEDLKRWVKTEEKKKMSKDHESMKELLLANKRLEEECKRLKLEREILKKAMAYFIPSQS